MDEFVGLLGGPVLGLVGTLAGGWLKLKERKLEMEAEAQRFGHEIALRKQEAVARHEAHEDEMEMNVAEAETTIAETIVDGSYKGLDMSLKHDMSLDGGPVINAIRASVRPFLTYALVTTSVGMALYTGLAGAGIEDSDVKLAMITSINLVSNLTGLTVTWWFGDRQLGKNNRYLA